MENLKCYLERNDRGDKFNWSRIASALATTQETVFTSKPLFVIDIEEQRKRRQRTMKSDFIEVSIVITCLNE